MKFLKLLPALAMLATPAAQAAGDRPASPVMSPQIGEFSLDTTVLDFPSGLRFLIQEDHSHPVASIYTYVGHGFNDDPEGAEETAHFVEHLWFRSVHGENLPPIMFMIQDLGTLFNATTANDRTDYRTTANIEYLDIMLGLESLRLTHFYRGVTEEQIDTEREVIRNEWRRRNEQSQSILIDFMNTVVYPSDHPYSQRSTHDTLNNIDLKVLQTYVDEFYKPADTTITIIGDFTKEELVEKIMATFSPELLHPDATSDHVVPVLRPGITAADFAANPDSSNFMPVLLDPATFHAQEVAEGEVAEPLNFDDVFSADAKQNRAVDFMMDPNRTSRIPPKNQRAEPPVLGNTEVVVREGPVDKRMVMVGWSLPPGYHDDHFNLVMLGNTASGFVARGLDMNFGDGVGGAFCFSQPQLLATTMVCGVEVNNRKLDSANIAEKMIDQLPEIWNAENASMFNLQVSRSKQESIKDTIDSIDLVAQVFGTRGESIGEYAHWTGNPNYYSAAIGQMMNVDGFAISNLAKKYLKRDRAAVLVVEPIKASDVDVKSADSSYGGASADDAVIQSSDDLSLATEAAIADSYAAPDLNKVLDTKLDNGMRVVILPHGDSPKAHARVIFGGGYATDPNGIHRYAANFSKSQGFDPLKIAGSTTYYFQPAFLGFGENEAGPLNTPTFDNGWFMGITAPAGNLDGMLWILRGELETAMPYMNGKASWVKGGRKRLKRNWMESSWHMSNLRNELLFPGSEAHRSTSWEDWNMWEEWGSSEVSQYMDNWIHPENATLLIVGKVDKSAALAEAQEQFGDWTANSNSAKSTTPKLETPTMPTDAARTVVFDEEKRTQTQTNMMCRLNSRGDEDRDAVSVLGRMLGNQ
ncbi:MAG: hypothetical protein GWP91_05890, partial [Rhodobacterales bacterium]|nr:hypothetical protein [Rhodobacterales bacterium]